MNKFLKEVIPYVVIVVVVVLFRSFIATPIVVDGASMEPTLYDGDMMILNKVSNIKRDDIVVIKKESYIIKRVIALPNEKVMIDRGVLYVNGKKQEDPFIENTYDFEEITLGSDEYLVLGDNREVSKDSRYYGPIKESEILGKANFIIYPFSEFGSVK